MKYYDPRADILFKKIFGRNEDLTISFLNAMLPLEGDGLVKTIRSIACDFRPLMKADNEPLEKIMRYTCLTLDEIQKI